MILTINQYLQNPIKGSSTSAYKQIVSAYTPRYEKLLEEFEHFETNIYKDGKRYFIHLKIPSETKETILYDIILEFNPTRMSFQDNINDWSFKVICNTPSFVYTYANVFKSNKLLILDFKSILNKENVDDSAKVRNPYKMVGFEKTIFYACKYIKEMYSRKTLLDQLAKKYEPSKIKKTLITFDDIVKSIDNITKKMSEDKKKDKLKEQKEKNKIIYSTRQKIDIREDLKPSTVGHVSTTKRVNNTKKTSTVKRAKRI